MNFLGKLFNKLQPFPEFSALMSDVDSMQKYENRKIASLQTAFGSNLSEFAKSQNSQYKQTILDMQLSANSQVASMRKLSTTTSSFSPDLKQISSFHDRISKSRKELETALKNYEDRTKELKSLMSSLDQRKQQNQTTITERAKIQKRYDECAASMQDEMDIYNSRKSEINQLEVEYRKTVMQIIIAAFESFSAANYRAYSEIAKTSKQIEAKANELAFFDDENIPKLEQRLKLLEKEEFEISKEEDPKPRS